MRIPFALAATCAATLSALALVTAVTPAAAIDTINCQQDRNPAERTICSSQRLQILDAKVTEAYANIMLDRRVNASIKDAVRESQYGFLQRRDSCGDDVECLTEVMGLRASRINNYR